MGRILCICLLFTSVEAFSQSPLSIVPLTAVTHTAVESGVWSNPSTWGGQTPSNGARIHIPEGREVLVDGLIGGRFKSLRLDGKLKFAVDVSTLIQVETIVGSTTGVLEIGTEAEPVQASVEAQIIFIDEGPIDLKADFQQYSKGLIMMGKTDVHGAQKNSWMPLAQAPHAGDLFLQLSEFPSGWKVGDAVVIAGTDRDNPLSDEKRVVASISGKTIGLDSALVRDHLPPVGTDFEVHLANLGRNVIFASENPEIARRGHVMFAHNLDVRLEYLRFYQMGRTNKREQVDDWFFPTLVADEYVAGDRTNIRGRYSCHFHRGGVDPNATVPALVRGCVIEDDPGWAYVNHSSHVDFIDNVSYNVVGGAFQTESGNEIGSFRQNIAIRTVNPDFPLLFPETAPVDLRESSQDFAFQGDAYWFHGGGVEVEGNVASGSSGHGFIYWTEGQREVGTAFPLQNMFMVDHIPNGDLLPGLETIQSWWIPLSTFRNNTTYSSTNGFAAYYIHATLFEDFTELSEAYVQTLGSHIEDLQIWNTAKYGMELQNCERLTFQRVTLVNEPSTQGGTIGIMNAVTVSNSTNWINCVVKGFEMGMIPPMQGQVHICGGAFTNETDFYILPPQRDSRVPGNARDLRMEGVQFGLDSQLYAPFGEIPVYMAGREALEGEVWFLDPEFQQKFFLIPDRIILDLPNLPEVRLYYEEQDASYTPITSDNSWGAAGTYRQLIENKTNQEIFDETGLAFAGALLPEDYQAHPLIQGGYISNTDVPMLLPACQFLQQPLEVANFYDDFDFEICWEEAPAPAEGTFQNGNHQRCSIQRCMTDHTIFTDTVSELYSELKVVDSLTVAAVILPAGNHVFQAGSLIRLEPPCHFKKGANVNISLDTCILPSSWKVSQSAQAAEDSLLIVTGGNRMDIFLFPNPANDHLNFQIRLTDELEASVMLSDPLGRVIWHRSLVFQPGENTLQLELSRVPPGLYYASVHAAAGQWSRPVVIE